MAIPSFGGMLVVLVSVFVVPVLYCLVKEAKLALGIGKFQLRSAEEEEPDDATEPAGV